MRNNSKTFFRSKDAVRFAHQLMEQGIRNVSISAAHDGFGNTAYRVEWN